MKNTVILVTRPGLGATSADDAPFGADMLDKFFHALETQEDKPLAVCFYTEGVKNLERGSPLELSLKLLERLGVRLVACRTCLDYYGIDQDLMAGELGTMSDIVSLMAHADKVISV